MIVKEFLEDIKNNPQIMKILGSTSNLMDSFINEVDYLYNNIKDRDYVKLTLKDNSYDNFDVIDGRIIWKFPVGTVTSRRIDNLIYRPVRVRVFDDEIWILSRYRSITRFDLDFSYKGSFGRWGNWDYGYYYPHGFIVTDNRVYIVSDNYHILGCFDRDTGEQLWKFGDGSPGVPESGRLYNPKDIAVLPNGNILVSCYNGQPSGATHNNGMIVEIDQDGNFVKVHLSFKKDGMPWNGDVNYPISLKIYQNPDTSEIEVWISYYNNDFVAIFTYDENTDTLTYKDIIGKTPGINVGSVNVYDFVVDYSNKRVYFTANGPKVLACLDTETHNLLGYIGTNKWEDYDNNPNTPGAFSHIDGLDITPDGRILVCDYTNDRVQQFPIGLLQAQKVEFEYEGEIPNFVKIDYISDQRFDLSTKKIIVYEAEVLKSEIPSEIIICGKFQNVCE